MSSGLVLGYLECLLQKFGQLLDYTCFGLLTRTNFRSSGTDLFQGNITFLLASKCICREARSSPIKRSLSLSLSLSFSLRDFSLQDSGSTSTTRVYSTSILGESSRDIAAVSRLPNVRGTLTGRGGKGIIRRTEGGSRFGETKKLPRQINDLIIRETFAADRGGRSLGKRRWLSPWIIEDVEARVLPWGLD